MNKLKLGWGLKALRYEERMKKVSKKLLLRKKKRSMDRKTHIARKGKYITIEKDGEACVLKDLKRSGVY